MLTVIIGPALTVSGPAHRRQLHVLSVTAVTLVSASRAECHPCPPAAAPSPDPGTDTCPSEGRLSAAAVTLTSRGRHVGVLSRDGHVTSRRAMSRPSDGLHSARVCCHARP